MSPTDRTPAWKKAIDALPEKIRAEIDRIWDKRGVLAADAVARLGIPQDEIGTLMMQLLPLARLYAVVPVSDFAVGAVAAGMPDATTGRCSLYLGANFEFADTALSFTVHAEQAATNNAWLSGERGIQSLAITDAPCGYCRQFLYELVTAQQLTILLPTEPDSLTYTLTPLTEFLPRPFGPNDLGVEGGLMDPALCSHNLALESGAPADPVVAAALSAACGSYAPYSTNGSHAYAGVAVQLADGSIYAGRHAENAAYNPSLSPFQSALAFMSMSQPLGATGVVNRCVLVEVPTIASQRSATQAALASYAPTVELEYRAVQIVT
ncbi:MAG: cytidine deaminase [Verrucomicrobiaceae bacterium]|nr:cytidine deaminase [Verrucomicrobiaceae bacterium]